MLIYFLDFGSLLLNMNQSLEKYLGFSVLFCMMPLRRSKRKRMPRNLQGNGTPRTKPASPSPHSDPASGFPPSAVISRPFQKTWRGAWSQPKECGACLNSGIPRTTDFICNSFFLKKQTILFIWGSICRMLIFVLFPIVFLLGGIHLNSF